MATEPLLTPQWLYDELMSRIEPDLVSNQLPLLDQKYAGETEEEHAARMEQYAAAYVVFDACLAELAREMNEDQRALENRLESLVPLQQFLQTHSS